VFGRFAEWDKVADRNMSNSSTHGTLTFRVLCALALSIIGYHVKEEIDLLITIRDVVKGRICTREGTSWGVIELAFWDPVVVLFDKQILGGVVGNAGGRILCATRAYKGESSGGAARTER
jgi:hypothetical protein